MTPRPTTPSTSRIGSQTIPNQIPAVARPWRISTRLAVARSTSLFGSNLSWATATAGSGSSPKRTDSVE